MMMKLSLCIAAMALFLLAACGRTTDSEHENKQNYNAADSAVGNSEAANTIYRDSSNITNATETGGGTASPYTSDNKDSGAQHNNPDSVQR